MSDTLVARWRKPIKVYAVQHDPDSAVKFNENTGWGEGVRWVTDADGFQRMWDGMACHVCLEVWETPWPEECPLCRYGVREHQRRDMGNGAVGFRGEEKIGGSTSISSELDRLDDFGEKWRWERNPTTGIIVPRGL